MTFPDPPIPIVSYRWWYSFGAASWARTTTVGTINLQDRFAFLWGEAAGEWKLRASIVATAAPSGHPFGGDPITEAQRWRLDTNTWVGNSGLVSGDRVWQGASTLGPTGAFRFRSAKEATFVGGSLDVVTQWTPWAFIWPTDIEEIPLGPDGIKFTARPSLGVSPSILEGIDGGSP